MASKKGRAGATTKKPGQSIELFGLKINIASDEECEAADAVVCAPATTPLYFPDNITGPCADCGDLLQWRPHAPKTPPRVCMRCIEIREISQRISDKRKGT